MLKKFTSFLYFAAIATTSCNDDLTTVGTSVLPPEDIITAYTDTFLLKAETVLLDSVFAKTSECMLGEIYDPEYGLLKSDFICQFYCEEGFKFPQTPLNGRIDSTSLFIMYPASSWYGDSLTPMQVSVFEVDKPLKRNFYTNDEPEIYCNMSRPLAAAAYTAYDKSISDSIRALESTDANYYSPNICIRLPQEFGQKIYDETVNNPASFVNQNAFNQFFPGFYVTTTFGSGNMIKTLGEYIVMRMYYSYNSEGGGSEGQDTILRYYQDFYVTKEVIQLNRFKNSHIETITAPQPNYTYIKTPAGVCTRLTVPTAEIAKKIDVKERFINDFTLKLKFLPNDDVDYAYAPPPYLLILPEDSVKQFFENGNVEDYKTSFVSYDGYNYSSVYYTQYGYSTSNYTYYFGNMSSLLKVHIEQAPDKDLKLMVIPVIRTTSGSSSYYATTSTYYTTEISNSLYLTGIKIRTEEQYMKVGVLSSKFENRY